MQKISDSIKSFIFFLFAIWQNRFVIAQLTKRDFQNRYLGSYLGLPWTFLKPLAVIGVMWFAFTYGLKVGKVDDTIPFALWLVIGIIPWFFLSENIMGSAYCLGEYAFLIKNISFRPSIIPLIKILTNSIIHAFFIIIIMITTISYGIKPSIIWIQVFYYMFCAIVLTIGTAWFFSSIQLFVKDVGHLLEVVLQLFFWGTPIIWSTKMLPEQMLFFIKLNPVYYIVEGYRNTFIYNVWFFEHYRLTLYYWCVTLFVFILGALVFKKLKPHFADVL
ncbi:MAG: ABC transporter permease [Desulfobacteraceae bacterium]|nr:ABC transporter permease [Desulfobacteraceae bacterium]